MRRSSKYRQPLTGGLSKLKGIGLDKGDHNFITAALINIYLKANLNISGTTLVACLFVASLLLSTSHCEDTQQSIVFLDSQSNIDLVMFNQ